MRAWAGTVLHLGPYLVLDCKRIPTEPVPPPRGPDPTPSRLTPALAADALQALAQLGLGVVRRVEAQVLEPVRQVLLVVDVAGWSCG